MPQSFIKIGERINSFYSNADLKCFSIKEFKLKRFIEVISMVKLDFKDMKGFIFNLS